MAQTIATVEFYKPSTRDYRDQVVDLTYWLPVGTVEPDSDDLESASWEWLNSQSLKGFMVSRVIPLDYIPNDAEMGI